MPGQEIRATHTPPDSPEAQVFMTKPLDELVDALFTRAETPIDTSPNTVVGYIPAGQPLTAERVVNIRDSLNTLASLQGELSYKRGLGKLVLSRSVNRLLQETAIPADAQTIVEGTRFLYMQHLGPQIANEEGAFWDLSLHQRTLTYQAPDGTTQEIPSARTNTCHSGEVYLDANGKISQTYNCSEPELRERLTFMLTSWPGHES